MSESLLRKIKGLCMQVDKLTVSNDFLYTILPLTFYRFEFSLCFSGTKFFLFSLPSVLLLIPSENPLCTLYLKGEARKAQHLEKQC